MPKTQYWQWYVEEFAPTEQHHHAIEELFVSERSPFQQIAVLRSPVFGKMLVIDGDTQSSQADERIYHEALVHPALAASEDRKNVLILGGGEGATLREVLRSPDVARCTMVDIDERVINVSKKFLPEWSAGAFDDARAEVIVGDALEHMRVRQDRYGVILSDLTEPLEDSPSNPLFNDDVFALIKSRLTSRGAFTRFRRAPPACTMPHCTVKWRVPCAATTPTSLLSLRTCPPSIPIGPSWPAATGSISRASKPRASTPTVHACVARAFSTTPKRTGAFSRCRSTCAEC